MSGELAAEVIEAAGGIVERDTPRGPLVAVIHRKRYGSEWALPKGKREVGEGWQATALREVEEELGLRPAIVGIAGATTYLAKGIPKFVLYWRMRVAQELAPFKPNEEVTRLEWLRPKAAIERLTHREEKDLLGRIYSPEAEEMRPLTAWLEKLCTPILRRRAWRRLGSTISAYEAELEARAASGKFPSAGLEPINLVVRRARDAVENGDLETGWKCFLAAQRIEFLYLDGAELDAEAAAIAEEADKLTAWRKKAVVATLSKTDGDAAKAAPRTDGGMAKAAPEPPTEAATAGPKTDGEAERARRVFRAALLLHEHFHNEAYKDGLRRGSSLRLFLFMALALIALLALAYAGYLGEVVSIAQNSNSLDDKFHILLSIGTVGLLGAVVSAITDMPGTSGSSRIPELTISFRVMMLRLLMGPASAIGLYFVIRSSFSPSVTHFSNIDGYAILVIAFAAGFSERLVLRVFRAIAENK